MPTHRLVRTGFHNLLTFVSTFAAVVAAVALVDHDVQRPAQAATLPAAAATPAPQAAAAAPRSPWAVVHGEPELSDLELVGRSIANHDR